MGYESAWMDAGEHTTTYFIERLWRTVKYEDVYLKNYESVSEAQSGLSEYFMLYNNRRRHQSLVFVPLGG